MRRDHGVVDPGPAQVGAGLLLALVRVRNVVPDASTSADPGTSAARLSVVETGGPGRRRERPRRARRPMPRAATRKRTRRHMATSLSSAGPCSVIPGAWAGASTWTKQGTGSAVRADDVPRRNRRLRQRRPEERMTVDRWRRRPWWPLQDRKAAAPGHDRSSATHFSQSTLGPADGFPVGVAGMVAARQLSSMALLRAHGWRKIAAALRLNARDATPVSQGPSLGAVGKAQTTSGTTPGTSHRRRGGHRAGSARRQRSAVHPRALACACSPATRCCCLHADPPAGRPRPSRPGRSGG